MSIRDLLMTAAGTPSEALPGQVVYTAGFAIPWAVPANVRSICILCVGGGALPYVNNPYSDGGDSYVTRGSGGPTLCHAGGGKCFYQTPGTMNNGPGGLVIVGTGGNGGQGGYYAGGGGGAGGYSGAGGNGGDSSYSGAPGMAGLGGGGGGGGAGLSGHGSAGGGGVGLLGQGSSGLGGAGDGSPLGGSGGSGGSGGNDRTQNNGRGGGNYGGGGAGGSNSYSSGGGGALAYVNNIPVTPGEWLFVYPGAAGTWDYPQTASAGSGAIRIIWGLGRSFPSTNTGDM